MLSASRAVEHVSLGPGSHLLTHYM